MQIFRPMREEDMSDEQVVAVLDVQGIAEGEAWEGEVFPLMVLDEDAPAPEMSGLELVDKLIEMNKTSESLDEYREKASDGTRSEFSLTSGGILLYKGRLVVPEDDNLRTAILREVHTRISTAHPGRNKTRRLVAARYWWPGVVADVDRFVANCYCFPAKNPRDKTPGLLHPLPPPERPWQCLVMDFKSMPMDKRGYNNVLVTIDRLSKIVWSTPCTTSATAKNTAMMYYEGPYRIFGVPKEIVSDRGPQFVADFADKLSRILGVKWKLSSSGHSQTAGQAEIINEYIDQRLRPFVNYH